MPHADISHSAAASTHPQIEDDLTPDQWEALTDCGIEDFADRDQISVEGCWKLLRTAGKVKVACKPHSKIGCMQCFDFMQQILDRVPALEAEPNAKVAAFNARRQQGGPQPPVFTPSGAAAPRPGAAASSSTAAAAAAQQPLRSI